MNLPAPAEDRAKGQMQDLKREGRSFGAGPGDARAGAGCFGEPVAGKTVAGRSRTVLQTLLAGAAEKGERQTLWAVAGPSLLRINAPPIPRRSIRSRCRPNLARCEACKRPNSTVNPFCSSAPQRNYRSRSKSTESSDAIQRSIDPIRSGLQPHRRLRPANLGLPRRRGVGRVEHRSAGRAGETHSDSGRHSADPVERFRQRPSAKTVAAKSSADRRWLRNLQHRRCA